MKPTLHQEEIGFEIKFRVKFINQEAIFRLLVRSAIVAVLLCFLYRLEEYACQALLVQVPIWLNIPVGLVIVCHAFRILGRIGNFR